MVSTRRKGKRVVYTGLADSSDSDSEMMIKRGGRRKHDRKEDSEDEYDVEDEEPKKKSKKERKINKRSSESVATSPLTDLPIDVLVDICSHLEPVDLLCLSRTSKGFFSLVDGPAFNSVWIESRESVVLPELSADDFSNLKYAALIYGDHCQRCGQKGRTSADYFIRKRWCVACRKGNLLPIHEFVRKIKAHTFLYECALSSLRGGGGANLSKTVYYDFPTLPALNKQLIAISSRIDALRPEGYRSIHSTNHMAVARRYQALLDKGEEDDEFEDDERELKEFVTEKRELKECVQKDAEKLQDWERKKVRAKEIAAMIALNA